MKNKTISVCINTNSKEIIAFQSISSLANHVKVDRTTIWRKSKSMKVIKDIEGFIIFLDVEYRRITK
jgi:DNA-binding MurR/RpiR family transcriptional regulator